jgi:hypothetical protein
MALVGVVGRKCAQGSTCTVAYRFTRAEGGWIQQQAMNLNCPGPDFSGHEFGVKSCLKKES